MGEDLTGPPGAQHVAVIDAVCAQGHRRHQRHHLRPDRPVIVSPAQKVILRYEEQPIVEGVGPRSSRDDLVGVQVVEALELDRGLHRAYIAVAAYVHIVGARETRFARSA